MTYMVDGWLPNGLSVSKGPFDTLDRSEEKALELYRASARPAAIRPANSDRLLAVVWSGDLYYVEPKESAWR